MCLFACFIARCSQAGQNAQQNDKPRLDIKHECENAGTTVRIHVPKTELLP